MHNHIIQVAKATAAEVIFALVFAVVFTLIVQLFSLSVSAIKITNQVFKIVAIAFGGLLFIREEKGLIKGAIYGLIATVLTYVLFSVISGSFSFSWTLIIELVLGAAAGALTGVFAVNIKKQ